MGIPEIGSLIPKFVLAHDITDVDTMDRYTRSDLVFLQNVISMNACRQALGG